MRVVFLQGLSVGLGQFVPGLRRSCCWHSRLYRACALKSDRKYLDPKSM